MGGRSRFVLLGLFAVFMAPLALASLLHFGVGSWFTPAKANRGWLLDPPRPAPSDPLELASGESLPADYFDRRWTLVHVAENGCAVPCEAALRAMRQAHRALGRNRSRVQRLLLVPSPSPTTPHGPDHRVARMTPAWEQVLRVGDGARPPGEGRIWIVDPRRFVISYFPADAGPRAIKHDLARLLKLSRWQTG